MSINQVTITGNLTRDPELRSTAKGTAVSNFSVAVNDRRKNSSTGEWENHPNYVGCVVFGRLAETVHQYLHKGSKVGIDGKLYYTQWETKEGQRRNKLEVMVDEIEFLDPKPNNQQGYQSYERDYNQPPQYQTPQSAPQQMDYYAGDVPF